MAVMRCLPCAGCQAHLASWREGLPACDMQEQDYVEGTWHILDDKCRPKSLEQVEARQYRHEHDCDSHNHVCNEETDTCRRKAVNISSYEWYPYQCNLLRFDAEELDRRIGRRYVLFVGDSLHLQQFRSFRQLMARVTVGPDRPAWNEFYTKNGGHFEVIAAQFLVGQPCCNNFENQSLHVLPDADWLQLAKKADILILSVGHHWHRRDVEFQHYSTAAKNVLLQLQADFQGTDVIFRTSSFGHHMCHEIQHPLPNITAAMTPTWMVHDPYHWMSPIWHEHVWQQLASKIDLKAKFWYSNSSMTLLRGDAHKDWQRNLDDSPFNDCLHYCSIILDYWNWMLYNTLISLEGTSIEEQ